MIKLTTKKYRGKKHYYIGQYEEEVPSVTTMLKDIVAAPGLVGWARNNSKSAAKQALEEYLTPEFLNGIKKHSKTSIKTMIKEIMAHEKTIYGGMMRKGSDFGTETHDLIQEIIQGKNPPIPDHQDQAIDNFLDWYNQQEFTQVLSEVEVACLMPRYAGTIDLVGKSPGKTTIVDFKTSKRFYPEMAYQVAGYSNAYTHMFDEDVTDAAVVILGKEKPSVRVTPVENLRDVIMGFLNGVNWYKSMKEEPWEPTSIARALGA